MIYNQTKIQDTMRKLRGLIIMLLISLSLFGLTACKGDAGSADANIDATIHTLGYEQITQAEAKEIMDSGEEYIIIDARTDEEFAEGHIEGAIMIPEYEISEKAEAQLPDKEALILVYCRSGRRSKIASEELVKLGYSNIKEFGGIIDWQYEIVK